MPKNRKLKRIASINDWARYMISLVGWDMYVDYCSFGLTPPGFGKTVAVEPIMLPLVIIAPGNRKPPKG